MCQRLGGGTLVAIVPSAMGLVVAADSRITFDFNGTPWYCDNVFKIVEPSKPDRTVVTITGTSTVWKFENLAVLEVCNFICQNTAQFDASSVVKSAIESNPALADEQANDLAAKCVDAVNAYLTGDPGSFDERRSKQIFQVAVSTYDPDSKVAAVRSFSVDLSAAGVVTGSAIKTQTFAANGEPTVVLFGESGFLVDQVLKGPGKQFLDARYGEFKKIKGIIQEVPAEVAANFASNLIEAAARTSEIIRPVTGIGGAVDIAFVTTEARPKRIRWKP